MRCKACKLHGGHGGRGKQHETKFSHVMSVPGMNLNSAAINDAG
jgi:hypothetical protein